MNTKTKKIVSVLAAGLITLGTVGMLSACGSSKPAPAPEEQLHQHTYVEHAAEDPTCELDGHAAYFTCPDCQKYFDVNKQEIAKEDIATTPKLGHLPQDVETVWATLTQDGLCSHSECQREGCDAWFWSYTTPENAAENKWDDEDRAWAREKYQARLTDRKWEIFKVTIEQNGATKSMNYYEYRDSDRSDEQFARFLDVNNKQKNRCEYQNMVFETTKEDGTGEMFHWQTPVDEGGDDSRGTYVLDEANKTLTTDINRKKYGHQQFTYQIDDQGYLTRTWTEGEGDDAVTYTIYLAVRDSNGWYYSEYVKLF